MNLRIEIQITPSRRVGEETRQRWEVFSIDKQGVPSPWRSGVCEGFETVDLVTLAVKDAVRIHLAEVPR